MSYIKLNGIEFDAEVAISSYNRSFNVLDGKNAGRVLTGRMIRDVIGTYIGHKIKVFRRGNNYKGLDDFWDYLVQHSVDGSVMLEAADGQKTISYEAYYTSGTQDIERVDGDTNYWGEIEVNFIPMEAQVKP
jgi:hypothetical protein